MVTAAKPKRTISVMTKTMLITAYCIVHDFINAVLKTRGGQEAWIGARSPKPRLALAEIIALNILRFYYPIQDLKAFSRLAKQTYKACFPRLPN
jgi:hypothetical protein